MGWVGFVFVALFSDGRVLDLAGSKGSLISDTRPCENSVSRDP